MSMKKLIEKVASGTGESQSRIKAILDASGTVAAQLLAEGEEVTLPGLGKLKPSERAARIGRNPKTGEEIQIPAKVAVKFSAAKALKDVVA